MAKSFKQMAQKDESTYMIVDALNLAFRYKHSKKPNFGGRLSKDCSEFSTVL